jgi:heat shock protein HslJ
MNRPAFALRRLFLVVAAFALGACAPDNADSGASGGPSADTAATDPIGSWTIDQIGGRPVVDDSPASLTFATDGTVAGNGSCNQFTGGYELNGDRMSLGPLAATSRMCASEALNDQEIRLFEALGEVVRLRIDGDVLTLVDAGGDTLVQASRSD